MTSTKSLFGLHKEGMRRVAEDWKSFAKQFKKDRTLGEDYNPTTMDPPDSPGDKEENEEPGNEDDDHVEPSHTQVVDEDLDFLPNFSEVLKVFLDEYYQATDWKLSHKHNITTKLTPKLTTLFTNIEDIVKKQFPDVKRLHATLRPESRIQDIVIKYMRSVRLTKTHEQNIKTYLAPLVEAHLQQLKLEIKLIVINEKKESERKEKGELPSDRIDIEGIINRFSLSYFKGKAAADKSGLSPRLSSTNSSSPRRSPSFSSASSSSSSASLSSSSSSSSSSGDKSLDPQQERQQRGSFLKPATEVFADFQAADPFLAKCILQLKQDLNAAQEKIRLSREHEEKQKEKEIEEHEKKAVAEAMQRELEERMCVVCMESAKVICFSPCGHLCSCEGCSEELTSCPLCQQKIDHKQRVYY